jgi:hypothetical protein
MAVFRLALALASVVLVSGCGLQGLRVEDLPRASVRSSWPEAGIGDQRQAFADVFCRFHGARPDSMRADCARWMWPVEHTAGKGSPTDAPTPPAPPTRTLVIAPGIFGECVAPWVTPFSEDYEALAALGYRIMVLPLDGRGSSTRNAEIIHERLSAPGLGKGAVVIGYSKGVTDFMLAASQPRAAAWRDNVAAFVSVAGTANGSPAANHGTTLYEKLVDRLLRIVPPPTCSASDGGGVRSLRYADAMPVSDAFAASRPPFRTYSVIAVAADGPVNPLLSDFHRLLSRIDQRNDGQVLLEDAVVPGSTVLGVFRADHWSIALPFEDSDAALMKPLGRHNSFPRGALIRALLAFTAPVQAHRISGEEN